MRGELTLTPLSPGLFPVSCHLCPGGSAKPRRFVPPGPPSLGPSPGGSGEDPVWQAPSRLRLCFRTQYSGKLLLLNQAGRNPAAVRPLTNCELCPLCPPDLDETRSSHRQLRQTLYPELLPHPSGLELNTA